MATSSTTTDPDWSPIRRAANWWRSEIDGQLDGAATAVRLGLQLFDQFAARGDLDALTAGLAAERRFQRLLEPFFANLHSRDQQQRVLVFLFIFGCGGGADIADQLADRGAARVIARETLRGRNARQVGQAHGDRGILLVGDIVGDRHRLEAARGGKLARDPLDLVGGQAHELGQLGNHLRAVDDLLGNQIDPKARPVDCDRLAVAVNEPAAPRRDRDQLHPVALAQQLVFLILGDRQPAHPADQQPTDRCLRPAEQHHPPRKGDRLMRDRDAHVLHRPSLHASMRETSQAKAGKTQMEMTSAGTTRVNDGAASATFATRHCSHSSIAISTAANTHSIQ